MTNAPAFKLGTSNPWQEVLSDQALAQAPNTDDYAGESYDLTGNTGRFIAIVANGWYEGVSAGLGKVRIDGTPPPPTGGWAIDGGGTFNLNTNWSDNLVPTTNAILGDALTAPNAPAAVTLDSPVSLAQVSFINPNTYSLDGPSTLTLTSIATLNASIGTHNDQRPDQRQRRGLQDRRRHRGAGQRVEQLHRQHHGRRRCARSDRSGCHQPGFRCD